MDGSQGRSQQLDFASEAMPISMYRRERHSSIDLLDRVYDESNACSLYSYHLCHNINLFLLDHNAIVQFDFMSTPT